MPSRSIPTPPRLPNACWRSCVPWRKSNEASAASHGSILAGRHAMYRYERVLEHIIRDAPALGDPLGLVERPVDPEVDAALAVFLLGLGEGREVAREERTDVAVVVQGHAVELVRHERE